MKRVLNWMCRWLLIIIFGIATLLSVWNSGDWAVNAFPLWLVKVIIGINLLVIIIALCILIALGIKHVKDLWRETK